MPYDSKAMRKGALAGISGYARKELGKSLKGLGKSPLSGDTSEKTQDLGAVEIGIEIEPGEGQVDVPGSLEKDEAAGAAVTKAALGDVEPADAQESLNEEPITAADLERLLAALGEG